MAEDLRVAADPTGGRARLAAARRIEQGNDGERRVAQQLDALGGAGWVMLHDRYKNAASPANLDHVAVGPPGVFVIDSKNWTGGRLRYDDRGMALGCYRRDDELHSAKVDADIVRRAATAAVPDAPVLGVLAFVEDVGLAGPVHHQQVMLLQSEQLLPWLTGQPVRLTPAQVHQIGSTLDAALPPRDGLRRPLVLSDGMSCPPGRRLARATAPPGARPAGRPTAGRRAPRRLARTAGQELAHGLRGLVVFLAVAALVLFVAAPIASRLLPPLLTRLVQASVPAPAGTPMPPVGGPTPPPSTCMSAPASLTPTSHVSCSGP